MDNWTLWATFLTLTGVAVLAIYLFCRARISTVQYRITVLEREMELARLREEASEQKLSQILEAVTALREFTGEQLDRLRHTVDQLHGEGYARQTVDAA
jgi:hypothetical protein